MHPCFTRSGRACYMLAALPAQPARGRQGLGRAESRTSQATTKQKAEQQVSADLTTVAPSRPSSKHRPDVLSQPNLLAAVASGCKADVTSAVPLASVLCRHFTLGRLRSDFPSRVEAYTDRLEYYFKHPSHGKVHMVMYFRDFGAVQVKRSSLEYKINTILDMFTAHYSPTDPQHMLSIICDSTKDLRVLYRAVQQGISTSNLTPE